MLLRRYGPFSYQTLDSLWPGTKEPRLKWKKRLISSNISATKNEVKSQKYYHNQIFNPSARLFAISELTEYIFELCLVMDDENFLFFPPGVTTRRTQFYWTHVSTLLYPVHEMTLTIS